MDEGAIGTTPAAGAAKIVDRTAIVGIIGLGYVGLPLAAASARAGFQTVGFDIDGTKVAALNSGRSYVEAVSSEALALHLASGAFRATDAFADLGLCDVIVICVPTPLSRQREPDLHFVSETTSTVARYMRAGQLIVLESTTYPGTTDEVVRPILEQTGLKSGVDFFLAFSPEREDPGNPSFHTANIPKVVAGDGADAQHLVQSFYGAVVERVVAVSTPATAEAVKITENVFRAVNIALVNELKVIFDAMGVDVWEVIEAAATKPFGYMPFYPGPGLGGHCIPIDPFYLTWKAREFGLTTRFIELAGEINVAMPRHVIARLEQALDAELGKSLGSSRILIIGLAYKKNVPDIRESPSFALLELLHQRGTAADYHDPHVPQIPVIREHAAFAGMRSVDLTEEALDGYDAVLISTDHDAVDYALLSSRARLIVDSRNAIARRGLVARALFKA